MEASEGHIKDAFVTRTVPVAPVVTSAGATNENVPDARVAETLVITTEPLPPAILVDQVTSRAPTVKGGVATKPTWSDPGDRE